MSRLKAKTIAVEDLKEEEIGRMYRLFSSVYENTTYEKFQRDLSDKDRVIVLKDAKHRKIRGFSTIKDIQIQVGRKSVYGIFSGDTVIDPDFWGQTALTMEFFKNLARAKIKRPFSPLFWFLISKGFKTYLLLAKNFYTFYPRCDRPQNLKHKAIVDGFASSLFGELYDQDRLILKTANKYDRLKTSVAPVTEECLQDPHIAFFSKMNKNWAQGDELCCVGRVDLGLSVKYLSRSCLKRFRRSSQKRLAAAADQRKAS